jgi:hypothetical protein
MAKQEHPLFADYPTTGTRTNWYGKVSTPYRVYSGQGALIGGSCDVTAARHMLRSDKPLEPAISVDRRALMGIWVGNYDDSTLDVHTELTIGLFVSPMPRSDIGYHPFMLLKLMTEATDLPLLIHAQWHNTDKSVGFKRDMLGIDAQFASSAINAQAGMLKFAFSERIGGDRVPIVNAALKLDWRTGLTANRALKQLFGERAQAYERAPYLPHRVINRSSEILTRRLETAVITGHEHSVVREWYPGTDRLELTHPYYSQIDFQPDFVQQFSGARSVHVTPYELDPQRVAHARLTSLSMPKPPDNTIVEV